MLKPNFFLFKIKERDQNYTEQIHQYQDPNLDMEVDLLFMTE
jgi:hypothetical protein